MDNFKRLFQKSPHSDNEKSPFPRFNPEKRLAPRTKLIFSHVRAGLSPLQYVEDVAITDKPYCFRAEDRWKDIMGDPEKYQNYYSTHDNIEVRVWDAQSKRQATIEPAAHVAIKGPNPFEMSEKSGLVNIGGKVFITSTIFSDEEGKAFVLVARQSMFTDELVAKVTKYFSLTPQ